MNKRIRKKHGITWLRARHPVRVYEKTSARRWRNSAQVVLSGVIKMPWNKLAMDGVAPWEHRRVEAAIRRRHRRHWRRTGEIRWPLPGWESAYGHMHREEDWMPPP